MRLVWHVLLFGTLPPYVCMYVYIYINLYTPDSVLLASLIHPPIIYYLLLYVSVQALRFEYSMLFRLFVEFFLKLMEVDDFFTSFFSQLQILIFMISVTYNDKQKK